MTNSNLKKTSVKFVGIPQVFVHHYMKQLEQWTRHFQRIGAVCNFWLSDPAGSPIIDAGRDSIPMLPPTTIVKLRASLSRRTQSMIIYPLDDTDHKKILEHCKDLEAYYSEADAPYVPNLGN